MCKKQSSDLKTQNIWYSIIIGCGIFVRLFHLFYNRSLWLDECYLATSLIKMNYIELVTHPLDYQQKAPIGFLWSVKTCIYLLGTNEMVLRLFPMLCGIVSIVLFIPVARYFLRPLAAVTAVAILAMAPPLVFHSVEIKQYSTELLATVLILYIYIRYQHRLTWGSLLTWGLSGAVILWFSYSSIFILAGIATGISCKNLYKRDWKLFFRQLVPFLLWLAGFALNYLLFTHKHAESKWAAEWFDFYHYFMPLPPVNMEELRWYPAALYHLIAYPLGLSWKLYTGNSVLLKAILNTPWLPLIGLFYGIWLFIQEKKYALILLFPFLFMCLASGLKLYPLNERFWVFICPLLLLFIVKGIDQIGSFFKSERMKLLLFILLIAAPVYSAVQTLAYPDEFIIHKRSFQKQALAYINSQFKPGDLVYVYWNDLPGYRFYKHTYTYNFTALEGGDYRKISTSYPDYLNHLQKDFKSFEGKKRIWVIYNHLILTDIGDEIDQPAWYYLKNVNPTDRLMSHLSTLGKQENVYTSFDVNVSLITLKP